MASRLILCLVVGAAGAARAADEKVDYERDVKPLFAQKCAVCHGALKQQVGLRLDAGVLIRKGSKNGPVIVPGKAAESLLIQKVTSKDIFERMPPDGEGEPLNEKQVAVLTAWINAGAVVPENEKIPVDPRQHWAYQVPKRPPLPRAPQNPRVAARGLWGRGPWALGSHPIDAFIAREHKRLGLTPVDRADRATLLRRVYLDLIGLPPTPQQLQEFLQDDSPDAWNKVVDSLLASPHYGERWGRHWMDVWRYSDWDGYKQQLRGSQRHIWRWRDWIVQSLGDDKGYDRMILEMLAGDELAPGDQSLLPATGFLARNFHTSNRNIWLDATVEHTAKAFLGLTINCARCHDHKFDPIPQTAYYQFRAIFEPHKVRTDRLPGKPDPMKDGLPRAFDADLDAATYLYLQGNEKRPDKEHPMMPAVPEILGGKFDVQPVELPIEAFYPALIGFVEDESLAAARKQLAQAEKALADARSSPQREPGPKDNSRPEIELLELKRSVAELGLESLQARYAAERAKFNSPAGDKPADDQADDDLAPGDSPGAKAVAAAAVERQLKLRRAELDVKQKLQALSAANDSRQKDPNKKKAAIETAQKQLADAEKNLKTAQQAVKKTDGHYTPLGEVYPRTSSGRRLALARWIASPQNPLTARVAVNHVWMRHFGDPLVENVFDFGLRSDRPRHADLLDWLAVELIENKWSMQHLHRLIVTSRTWQLASSGDEKIASQNREIDADNHYLWRANVRRLDAEIVRDSLLAVSGQLDRTLGGADVDFRQGETSRRRSIYLRHAYEKQMTMLVLFDAASPNECYRRSNSIVPQQGLALMNSSLSLGSSRVLAASLWKQVADAHRNGLAGTGLTESGSVEFIRAAFLQLLTRPPRSEELAACREFLDRQAAVLSDTSKLTTFAGGDAPQVNPSTDPHQRARENLVHVLMNHNDFITVR